MPGGQDLFESYNFIDHTSTLEEKSKPPPVEKRSMLVDTGGYVKEMTARVAPVPYQPTYDMFDESD